MNTTAIIIILVVLLVLCVVGLITGLVMCNKKQPKAAKSRKPRIIKTKARAIHSDKICSDDSQCDGGYECDIARMYHVDNFDRQHTPADLQGTKLVPFQIRELESRQIGVNDVMDYKDTLFIATTAPYIYLQPLGGTGRLVKSNIVAEDVTVYDGKLIALESGRLYACPLAHIPADDWTFQTFMGHDNVTSIEASADGRGLVVNTTQSKLIYIDGKQTAELEPSRHVFGASPSEYAQFNHGQAIIQDTGHESIVVNADAGVFTKDGDFYYLDSNRAHGKVTRIRQVANEPVFVSERVCKPKKTKSVRELTL